MIGAPLLLLGGGGAAVAYVATKGAPAPALPGPTGRSAAANPGATRGQQLAGDVGSIPPGGPSTRPFVARGARSGNAISSTALRNQAGPSPLTAGTGGNSLDATIKQKFDLAQGYCKAAFDNMDDAAKQRAADTLNKTIKPTPNPPLDSSSSWATVASVAGAAAGGAIGAYLGGPLGAKVGALLGAYLGVTVEEWCSRNYDDLKSWAADKWGDVESWVTKEANDAIDFVGGLF